MGGTCFLGEETLVRLMPQQDCTTPTPAPVYTRSLLALGPVVLMQAVRAPRSCWSLRPGAQPWAQPGRLEGVVRAHGRGGPRPGLRVVEDESLGITALGQGSGGRAAGGI